MIKDRVELEDMLDRKCMNIAVNNDSCKAVYTYANEKYNIPKSLVLDLISKRVSMSEVSEFVLFIVLDSIYNSLDDKRLSKIEDYYTEKEIQFYKGSKYKNENIKFPLVFKMIQVEEDQWIGKIDVKTLMKLRKGQIINYNVNAQRTMQRIVKGDKESFKISLNQKAISEIISGYKDGSFVPNTLTLNMPVEIDPDFYYDSDTCSLIIRSIEHFDITDGYHRYIALSQISDLNNEFDYNMELRIVNFTEDKAKQFIFQEDQKTKMRKVDSNSLNMNKAANIVVTRLNESVRCNLKGLISRNEGIISFGELADLVNYFYFRDRLSKEKEKIVIIQAVKELTENFNMLTEYNTDFLEHRMKYRTLLTAMFCFDYFKDQYGSIDVCDIIEKAAAIVNKSDNKKFVNKTPRKTMMNEVEKIVKGVM